MGTRYLAFYRNFVEDNLGYTNTELLAEPQVNREILAAVDQFSIDLPLQKVALVQGDGGYSYDLPTDWEQDFSLIKSIEHPVGEQQPVYMKPSSYILHDVGEGNKLQFLQDSIGISSRFAVRYTVRHDLTETTSTIADGTATAMAWLATAYTAVALAGQALRNKDQRGRGGSGIDAVDFRTISQEYLTQARECYMRYIRLLGLPEKGPKAATFIGDLDPVGTNGYFGYLTHFNR